jgi:hypothetical protein
MIIWKGWGVLTFLLPLVCSWAAAFVLDSVYYAGFYKNTPWAMPLVIGLSAIPVAVIGYKLNRKPGRKMIDVETNEVIEIKEKHTLFYIPMQYWSVIIVVLCLWLYASNIGLIYQ